MRVLRFMSVNEAFQLIRGGDVKNGTDHKAQGNRSNAFGCCFAILKNKPHSDEIFDHGIYLSGIVTMDVCLVATLKSPAKKGFKRTFGGYKQGDVTELSSTNYALSDFEEWTMYAPNNRYTILPTASHNWLEPVEIMQRQDMW
jgi:hypothetical protein